MEHLVLGLVWLLGMLATVSPKCQRGLIMEELDMAPNSFDDQYLGCSDKMEEELQELNRTEFESNKIYAAAWKKASAMLQGHTSQPSVLKPAQAIALMAYTLETPSLYLNFNSAVRQAGRSREQYLHNFQFKAMHFLLTKALQALRKRGQCYNVYRGVKKVFTAQPGDTVRFGQFASTSLNKNCAESFGMGTIFSVQTCYGVPIWDFSYFATEKEVLIPPFEAFEVTSVTHKGNSARIELQSQGVHSNYNCEFVRGDDLEDGELLLSLPEKQCSDQPCDSSAGELRAPRCSWGGQSPSRPPASPAAPACPSLVPPGHSVSRDPVWGFLLAATALATAVGI